MMDTANDLEAMLDRASTNGYGDKAILRAMSLDFRESLLDAEALREENGELRAEVARLREKFHEPPSVLCLDDEWVRLKEAAYQTRYSRECLRLWAHAGLIEAKRRGGQWRVLIQSAKDYVASKRAASH